MNIFYLPGKLQIVNSIDFSSAKTLYQASYTKFCKRINLLIRK